MNNNDNNYAIILASGPGVKLWPLSTKEKPKQFHDLLGIGKTFIQLTFERLSKVINNDNIYIVTIEEYKDILIEQLPTFKKENFIIEPRVMNTAACTLLATYKINQINPEAKLIISPSDHFIYNEEEFSEKTNLAFNNLLDDDKLITLGVVPSRPDTDFSYIQFINDEQEIKKTKSFIDKPSLEFAESFLKTGEFLWNTNILICSVKGIIAAFNTYLEGMSESLKNYFELPEDLQNIKTLAPIYTSLDIFSINKGILEKSDHVFVIPCNFGWSDIGTWSVINDKYKYTGEDQDNNNNTLLCSHFAGYNTKNSFIYSTEDKAIVVEGLDDYIVVNSERGLLICPRNSVQNIKTYVGDLKLQKNGEKYC